MRVIGLWFFGMLIAVSGWAQSPPVFDAINQLHIWTIYDSYFDEDGNYYITGRYFNGDNFDIKGGTSTLASGDVDSGDGFVAKYDSDGNLLWVEPFSGDGIEYPRRIKVDSDGNVYVAGNFVDGPVLNSLLDFDPDDSPGNFVVSNAGDYDGFLVSFDPNGNYRWHFENSTTAYDDCSGFDFGPDGNLYHTGVFGDELNIDRIDMATGDWQTSIVLSGDIIHFGGDLTVTDDGFLFVSGNFAGTIDLNPDNPGSTKLFSNAGSWDAFTAYYNLSDLTFAGDVRQFGGDGEDIILDAAYRNGEVYLMGYFHNTFFFPEGSFTSAGGKDFFVIKYYPGSTFAWANQFGGTGEDDVVDMDFTSTGHVYLTGTMMSTVDFDPDPVGQWFETSPDGSQDAFVLKLSQYGQLENVQRLGSVGNDFADALAVDNRDRVYFAHYYSDYINVDVNPSPGGHYPTTAFNLVRYYDPPRIGSFEPQFGRPGTNVFIYGENLSDLAERNAVYFGAARAEIISSNQSVLVVQSPTGATYEPISVAVNGLTGYSHKPFSPTFEMNGDIATSYSVPIELALDGVSKRGSVADLNEDGKPDIIAPVPVPGSDRVSVFTNQSEVASLSPGDFPRVDLGTGANPYATFAADLDGDGLRDIIVGEHDSGNITILSGDGSSSSLSVGGQVTFVTAHDLDEDGRPEIVAASRGGYLMVFENDSRRGFISFPFAGVLLPTSFDPWSLAIGDIDYDTKPDIVSIDGAGVFRVFRNVSITGQIDANSFQQVYTHSYPGYYVGVVLSDLDNDQRLDAIISGESEINILKNVGDFGGPINFDASFPVIPSPNIWNAFVADVDGDSKPDIISANIDLGKLTIYKNACTPGVINGSSFPTQVEIPVSGSSRPLHVSFSDLDGDTRPDLVVNDENNPSVWVFRNLNVVNEPTDQPTGLYFSEVTSSTAFGRFTTAASNPDGYIVIRKSGETASTEVPVDGVAYPVGWVLDDGAVVVYSGKQPFFNASGLFENGGAETFSVYSFNGGYNAVNYYTDTEPLTVTLYQRSGTPLHNTYFHWAKQIGGDLAKGAGEIAVGPDGSVYLTGYFEDPATDFNTDPNFTTTAPKISGAYHGFLAKYSPAGDLQWVQSIPSNSFAVGEGIDVDNAGNVYVLGKFVGDVNFYDIDLAGYVSRGSNGGVDIFLAKYDATGNFQWSQSFGGPYDDDEGLRNGLEVDGDGYMYVTGEFQGNAFFNPSFGGENLTSRGGRDIYVAKYEPANGALVWLRQVGGTDDDYVRDVAVDAASGGNVIIAGQVFSTDVFVEGVPHQTHGNADIFAVKYDNNGNLQWVNILGGPNNDFGEGVTTDLDGSVYLTGTYNNHADFDGGPGINFLTSNSGSLDETFLAKYDVTGSLLWVKSMNANAAAYGIRVKADGLGSVYLLGDFESTINGDGNSGNYSLSQNGGRDVALYKYSTDGFLRWAGVIGGNGNDYSADLAITPNDEVVITGTFGAEAQVDPNNSSTTLIPFTPAPDIFMIKFGPNELDFASVPVISSVSPKSGPVGSYVTILGSNFDPNPEGNIVFFGAAQALVSSAASDQLEVQVPIGATFEPITVTTRGLTAASAKPFIITYVSSGTMDASSFDAINQISFGAPASIALADFDQNGYTDIVAVSPLASELRILYNESSPGTISIPEHHVPNVPLNPVAVRTGDLDGDGRPDIVVVSQNEDLVSVYRNMGSRSFAPRVNFAVGAAPNAVDIRDIDGDGKQDLVVTNGGSSSMTILKNRSIPGSITPNSFGSRVDIGTGTFPTDVQIGDLQGDSRPDIAVVNNQSNNLTIFINGSNPGAIQSGNFGIGGAPSSLPPLHIGLGDMDGDGLTDIVFTNPVNAQLSMAKNFGGTFNFPVQFGTQGYDVAVAIGDINGDGFLDAVTGAPLILLNKGTGTFDGSYFSTVILNDADTREDVAIGDIDGDGRPDIVVANDAGSIGIYRNNSTIAAPTVQASAVQIGYRTSTSVEFGFTPGDGNKHMSVMKQEAPVDNVPQDGAVYQAPTTDNVFGTGSDLGNGNQVVALGEVDWTGVTTLGLEPETEYHVAVFDYNDLAGYTGLTTPDAKFLTELNGNTASFYTLSTEPTGIPSIFTATAAGTAITLNFSPASDISASGYLILRGEGSIFPDLTGVEDGTMGLSLPPDITIVSFVNDATATSYFDSELTPLVAYNYVLVPFAWRDGIEATTNYYTDGGFISASATTTQFANPPSNAPTNFTVEGETLDGFTISFEPSGETPSPTGYLAIRQAGADPTFTPQPGIEYTVGEFLQNNEYVAFVGNTGTNPITFTESGLTQSTTYFYRIYSFNGSGSSIAYLTAQSLADQASTLSPDANDPLVTNLTPDAVQEGESLTFKISVNDESSIVKALVYYRSVSSSEPTMNEGTMTFDGSNYTFFLSGPIGLLGVEYQFYVEDYYGNAYEENSPRLVKINYPDEGLTIPYNSFGNQPSNYRIVAVPLNLENKSLSGIFVDDVGPVDNTKWRVFRYQNGHTGELSSGSSIEPGRGYWLIVKDPTTIDTGPGKTVEAYAAAPFTIPLTEGWNQIGNPYNFDIAWSEVADANPGVPTSIIRFNGSGFSSTLLDRFEGGFIFMEDATELVFPTRNPSGGRVADIEKLRNPIDQPNWDVDLVVEQGDLTNVLSGVGMRSDASAGYDRYDGMSLPRFNEFLELNHDKELHGFNFTRDVVATGESNIWEFSIASSSEERFITISWDNSYFGNNEKSLILWDVNLQLGIDMRVQSLYKFDRYASGNFRILFGDSKFLKENTGVNSLVFHHILPNPVRDEATFCFSLPEAGPVTIEVLDVTGRKSERVFEGILDAGYHEVSYRNSDYDNAGGVYIARIKAGAASAQQRMVLQN